MTATVVERQNVAPGIVRERVRRVRRVLRIVRRATAINIGARAQYPVDFSMDILFGIVWQTSTLAFAAVLITRFSGLGHFPAGGVLLIVGMRLVAHGFYTMIFGAMSVQLSTLIEEGRFERFLLRPVSVLTQVLISRFQINAFGDLAVGITMAVIALTHVAIAWTPAKAVYLVLAIAGGVLVEAAVQLAIACLMLRSPSALMVGGFLDDMMATFGNYPLSILPALLRGVFTFVLPVAFIAYFPTLVLLGKAHELGGDAWMAYWSPAVGLVLFLLAKRLWNWSLRHFQSVGG